MKRYFLKITFYPLFIIDFPFIKIILIFQMGLSLIFTEDSNFKNLLSAKTATTALPINEIFHKACIDVNESGSETSNVEGKLNKTK